MSDATGGGFWLRDATSTTSRPTRVPLVIYVLWHPSFAEGTQLAREISDWCGGGALDIRAAGTGIPVFYRSVPWDHAHALTSADEPRSGPPGDDPEAGRARAACVWRRPIDLDDALHNVFVPFVDDHMVDDPSWRRDLIELARRHCDRSGPTHVHLAPIQVTSAWSRMPAAVSGIQPLFLRRWSDGPDDTETARLSRWRPRIRRLLTQALVRLLGTLRESSLPTEIFLSHAKADLALGPGVAERLRDVAAGYGQIEVFYDENDLPSGADWANRMFGSVRDGAGFVAVLSDAYATRYWCRREVQLARTPVLASHVPDRARGYIWRVRPTVVTVTMQGTWSRLIGDFATVPAIRWKDDEHHAAAILDQVFREALLSEFQVLYAEMLHDRLSGSLSVSDSGGDSGGPLPLAYLTWTPDPATLLRLHRQVRAQLSRDALVVYPGHGFLPTEAAELADSLGPHVTFVSFERLADLAGGGPRSWTELVAAARAEMPHVEMKRRPLVALSAGDSDDLPILGYDPAGDDGSQHVDAGVLRLCRTLLAGQARLVYGGVLRTGPNFASLLQDIVIACAMTPDQERSPDPRRALDPDPETPLETWVARPFADRFPVAARARMLGLCRYYFVGDDAPPGASPHELARAQSLALSTMRARVAERTAMTLALAGRRWGFGGVMPGVAEEILCAVERGRALGDAPHHQVRVLLVGEYGGIVREIARYLLGRADALPAPLTLDGQLARNDDRTALLLTSRDMRALAADRYAALAACLATLRDVARMPPGTELPALGITVGEWTHVMATPSIGFIRRLVMDKILPRLHQRAAASRA